MSNKITVTAQIAVKPEKAWNYYTLPEHITQWNFASDDWHCPWAENNLKVGGKYAGRMEAKDGSFGFTFEAIYTDIDPGKAFHYTMGDGREAEITFEDKNEYTTVSITFDAESENSLELQQAGWQAILNNYKRYSESK